MRTRYIVLLGSLGSAVGVLIPSQAWPASASATLLVSATVVNTCMVKTSPLVFGPYDPGGENASSPPDGAGAVTLKCSAGTAATIAILPGRNPGGDSLTTRAMAGASDHLAYEVYKDPDRTKVWLDGADGALSVAPASSTEPRQFPIYGRIPPGQDVAPGPYWDLAVVSIKF